MELRLFLRRQQPESTFVFSLMNYNKLNFYLFTESSLTSHKITNKEAPGIKTLPALQIIRKSKENVHESHEDILKYLCKNNLIRKGISYSAWEEQSYTHLTQTTLSMCLSMQKGFSKRLQQSLKLLPRLTTETIGIVSEAIKDTFKLTLNDLRSDTKRFDNQEFRNELKDWQKRLCGQDYHGGHIPDKADFFMYACLESTWIFSKPFVFDTPDVWAWKARMDKLSDQDFIK
jgi:hypothetical protein